MDINNLLGGMMSNMIILFVVIGVLTVILIFVIMRWARGMAGMGGEQKKILETGVPGQAQILGVQQTGTMINHNPVAIVYLKVQHPDGHLYDAQVRRLIPIFQMMQFQQGAVVPVMIDREDPSKVVIAV